MKGPRFRVPTRYVVAAALYIVVAALFIHDWDGYVFERSVRDFYAGHSPYTVAEEAPFYTFLNVNDHQPQWYAYPPLPLLAMSVTFLPEMLWNLPPVAERVLIKLPILAGTLALAAVAGAWARSVGAKETTRIRIERLLLFNPFLIVVGPVWGMTDPALVALFLAGALRSTQGRPRAAGVYFALSLLIKPFPALLGLPLVAYLTHQRGWKEFRQSMAAGMPILLGVSVPFLLTNPDAFWNQVFAWHLHRETQGLTLWSVGPLAQLPTETVRVASLTLLVVSLVILSFLAPRLRGSTAPLVLLLATSVQVLLWNRIVNEQYLTLVVAPLVLLYGLGELADKAGRWTARGVPLLFTGLTLIQGFHFLTFIPPDLALKIFHNRSVDVVAYQTRLLFNWGIDLRFPHYLSALVVSLVLMLLAFLSLRALARQLPSPHLVAPRHHVRASGASILGCLFVLLLGFTPLVSPAAIDARPLALPDAPPQKPLVGAFYYLWWNNAAHDPDTKYGNWLEASQYPELGFYTNTRGVHRAHVQMMHENGIDVAIVSYHSVERERYQVFQEEAARQGLLVAPLIELNQVYDQPPYRPLNETEQPIRYAAYRLTNETRQTIERFVLELKPFLTLPSTYHIEGRPVIFFYDSYVSGVGFSPQEKQGLCQKLLEIKPLEELRRAFHDSELQPTCESILQYYPNADRSAYPETQPPRDMMGFYFREKTKQQAPDPASLWRQAHLALHQDFWRILRQDLERELGSSVFLVSGESYNERAGFEAGTIKSIENLDVFDGSFIYSPSFTWGVQPRNSSYEQNFRLWEDRNLWLTSFARGAGRLSAYGVAPSYDDTVKRGATGFVISPTDPQGRFTYDRSWEHTLSNPPGLVLLSTFNEFFEGSGIEPDSVNGPLFLNNTRAYRERLLAAPTPAEPVVALVHERSSRLNANFSETDDPHWWGLQLVTAAARTFAGGSVAAWDAQEPMPADMPQPRFLLLDGGRDGPHGYPEASFSAPVLERLGRWTQAGVPTVVFGWQVADPLRALYSADCRENNDPNEFLDMGDAPFAGPNNVNLAPGDRLEVRGNLTGPRHLFLTHEGRDYEVGYQCKDQANLAFLNIKPWGPGPINPWQPASLSDPDCLRVVLTTFFPQRLPAGELRLSCTVPPPMT